MVARIFYMIAKLPFIQNHYIRKYNFTHKVEDGWSILYSGDEWVDATGIEGDSWKHRAAMHGLANNPLVVRLIIGRELYEREN